jgi:hypothetical protein
MAENIIFTVRVYGKAHESRASELAHVQQALQGAAASARGAGGTKLSGVILGDGGVEIGEWRYEPSATATPAAA